MRRNKTWIPALVLAAIAVWLTIYSVWYGDAVSYAFFIPHTELGISYSRITTLGDIWVSQINHYLFTNGRFACHYVVQILCGLLPHWVSALLNGAAWWALLTLMCRIIGCRKSIGASAAAAAMLWLACYDLPYSPPYQVNYVWCGVLNLATITIFLSRRKFGWVALAGITALAFLAGEWNESFSMPVALALLIYACAKRFRVTPVQWCVGLAYAIGTLAVCLAPGTLSRFGTGQPANLMVQLYGVLPIFLFPAALLLLIGVKVLVKKEGMRCESIDLILMIMAATGYLIGAAIKFNSGARLLICPNIAIIILLMRNIRLSRTQSGVFAGALTAVMACVLTLQVRSISLINEKMTMVKERYHESPDGKIYIPDNLFAVESRTDLSVFWPLLMEERSQDPKRPCPKILPESLREIDLKKDTNMAVPISDQGWILVQSRRRPAEFVVEKTLLPGVMNKKMAPRTLEFTWPKGILILSTEKVNVGAYVNERPIARSEIRIEEK